MPPIAACRLFASLSRARYEQRARYGRAGVSQSDSFIQEVTEEVRRDRLYRLARQYGWIAVLAVLLVVGGAAYLEWRKARSEAQAQTLGDRMYAALESGSSDSRAAALADVAAEGTAAALARMLAAGQLAETDPARAGEILEGIAANETLPVFYRDAATLKLTMIPDNDLPSGEKLARLEPLTEPGAPLRLMALEQMALVHLERGEQDTARDTLRTVAEAAETSQGQRQRIRQLLTVLGGDPEGA
jgi:hypothetical protein